MNNKKLHNNGKINTKITLKQFINDNKLNAIMN